MEVRNKSNKKAEYWQKEKQTIFLFASTFLNYPKTAIGLVRFDYINKKIN
ncbi:hypothetical protein [Bacteroides neonati]|nr:hypothetical protein [Bacteroides neonati]